MITTYLFALALASATPTAWLNGEPTTYDIHITQTATISGAVDHYGGYEMGYTDVSLNWYGSYDSFYNSVSLYSSDRITTNTYFNGSIDEDYLGAELPITNRTAYNVPSGHFKVTMDMKDGIAIVLTTPTGPDDSDVTLYTEDLFTFDGGLPNLYNNGEVDLTFYESDLLELLSPLRPADGFEVSQTYQDGYAKGHEDGYTEGLATSQGGNGLNNAFGLFSKAFASVSSFFEMKIFGFLPLYWFFLAPLFIALLTLLLRMVRH